ncbi:Dye-decolorizing peroxidase [Mycena indigotica]|uniref:N(6)-L-threonylcarbamoyladenine synthase n=1 Tax=Mycena indigotica TaxID=2126181 RepID=A0A8H6TAS2_9AGAR|nr:Dye-decolorizing peroxidase [Mycena indigotica]KAF7315335.1 Dye-decolorizing peroxidase [Mycena indigotica]
MLMNCLTRHSIALSRVVVPESRLLKRNLSSDRQTFKVIALESSADDTCAAIVDNHRNIWSNVIARQNSLHEINNGIHPLHALHAHQRNMARHIILWSATRSLQVKPMVVRKALDDANLTMNDINGVAFTRGPGITGCLTVAANAAKTLAAATAKPLVGVHHMQAHALTAQLTSSSPPEFPFLCLLVSGGHTMIVLATTVWDWKILATSADRAIGSAIDRVVTLLQIPWTELGPGPGLERFCAEPVPDEEVLETPPPIIMPGQLAFSFTGIHSWVERTIHKAGGLQNTPKRAVARAFQESAFQQLTSKLILAFKWCQNHDCHVQNVIVSGGVASNLLLRKRLKDQLAPWSVALDFPDPSLCTDNAVMIGWAAMHRFMAGDHDEYSIGTLPVWSLEDLRNPPPPPAVR